MSYPGNPSLTRDVQDRISTTFLQTLDLVSQGKDQEAVVGCEFILRMDPAFAPAKTLIQRLKSPQRPVAIDDLRASAAASQAPPAADVAALDDLDDLGSLEDLEDLGDLDDLDDLGDDPAPSASPIAAPPPAAAPSAAPPPAAAPASGLAAVIQDLLQKRNFPQVLQIAENQKDAVAQDPQVQQMVQTAQSRLESDAFVKAFLRSAREAQAGDRHDEMEAHLNKARALDPEHPDLLAFAAAPSAAQAAAGDDLLAFATDEAAAGDEDLFAAETPPPPAAAADDDLLALQEQSLALESTAEFSTAGESVPQGEADLGGDELGDLTFEAGDQELQPDIMDQVDDLSAELSFEDLGDDLEADLETATEAPELEAPPPPAEPALAVGDDAAEGGDRIAQLLEEGEEVFQRGEYQAAIDVWSRIFLIDIDNQEASGRIEEARSKKAELERRAEEVFHDGVGQIEEKALEEAKASFRKVLELDSSHSLAREYLEQLEAGQVPAVKSVSEAEAGVDLQALSEVDTLETAGASPSMEAAVERDRIVVVKKTDKRLIAVGALVSLLVIAGVGYLVTQWDDLFPNREESTQEVVRIDPFERATKMHQEGRTENAIIVLERNVRPGAPDYDKAQALIAQWKALVETPPEEGPTGPSEEEVRRLNLLLDAAREAHADRQYIRARKYFDRAAKIAPLEAEDLKLKHGCDQALEPLEAQIELFGQGEYAQIIPALWRQRESEPSPDIDLLLIDSYYNLALTDLQRGDALGAAKKLEEALEIQPDSRELERMRLFAQTYIDRPQDLLYRIYVKYLPSRS